MMNEKREGLDPDQNSMMGEMKALHKAMTNQTFSVGLAAFRAQNPFVKITAIPNSVIAVVLAAGVAKDVHLADGTKAVRVRGNKEYWLNTMGNAQVPAADYPDGGGSICSPNGDMYFVEELNSLSLCAPADDTIVSVECFVQL